MKKNILIVAGEPSGDIRAGELIAFLKKTVPNINLWGIGGDAMSGEGVELVEHVRNLSIVGLWEALRSIFKIRRQYIVLKNQITCRKPDLAILIDYPGFNLHLASFLKKNNIPVVYYIIPQVWAWGKSRIKLIERYISKTLVLFDFEEKLLKKHGIDCTFVGHPLVDSIKPQNVTSDSKKNTIALLPGSRKNEILVLLPIMLEAAEKLSSKIKDIKFVLAQNSAVDESLYNKFLTQHPALNIVSFHDDTSSALAESGFAIVTSGTATLETALCEVPMVIVYKGSPITYLAFKLFVRIPFIGLVNIIAGKEVAPEFWQQEADPDKLCDAIYKFLNDPDRLVSVKNELRKVSVSLGEKGAARRASEEIAKLLKPPYHSA